MKKLLITGYGNTTSEGVTLFFNTKVALHGGVSSEKWCFSWDKIGTALFPDRYCESSDIDETRKLSLKAIVAADTAGEQE